MGGEEDFIWGERKISCGGRGRFHVGREEDFMWGGVHLSLCTYIAMNSDS